MKYYFLGLLCSISLVTFCQKVEHVQYGTNLVGFHSSLEFDYSRPARNKNQFGRAVQINIWYPSENGKGASMDFKEYLSLVGKEDSATSKSQSDERLIKAFLEYPASQSVDMQLWAAFLSHLKPMKAKRNALFQKNEYPVVQLIHSSAVDYSVLGEYLASHGMVVINVPYKGYLQNTFDVNLFGMETEIRDQEFAFDFTVRKFGIKPKKVGLVGISFGGQSAVGLAVRNPLVNGIVSLDGGIGSTFGPQLLAGHPFYNVEKVKMPILHLFNPADPGGNIDWFNIAEYNDRYLIAFKNMDHAFFGIKGLLDNELPHILGSDKPRPGANYEAILLYTLTFFKELFENDLSQPNSVTELDQQANWISSTIQSKDFKKTRFQPLPLVYLQEIIRSKGIEALFEVHQKQKVITPMPISDGSYRSLFLEAFGNQNKPHMLKLSEYYEGDFPQSAFAKYYGGRALQASGQIEESKKCFVRCLELLNGDANMSAIEKETVKQRAEGFLKN